MAVVNSRQTKVQSFYFNLQELASYWNQTRAYHHTSPISMTYALREALRMMMEEGIENRIRRHARVAAALRAGLEALDLELIADPGYRLDPLTTVPFPTGPMTRRSAAPSSTTTTSRSAEAWVSSEGRLGASG
jgi:alanine-glyoxylate transaminase/serine-glyoxylate transaminase/serine-pyruvate transaminase